ncbi:hypothetical protein D3C78_1682270 [compost metagenome]
MHEGRRVGNPNDHPAIGPIPGILLILGQAADEARTIALFNAAETGTHLLTDRGDTLAQPNIKQLCIGPLSGYDTPLLPRYQLGNFGGANGAG